MNNQDPFSDPKVVAAYSQGPARNVPGWADMMRMADLLLSERASDSADILIIGAGGGLELQHFAESHPDWTFLGIDPSHDMMKLARTKLGVLASRVHFHEGYVETAPTGLYDAGTCLLTLHFVPQEERCRMLKEVRRRLRPGAPFVVAHLSFPQAPSERELWLGRYAAFIASSGIDLAKARAAAEAVGSRLPIQSPQQDEATLRDAGFSDIQVFYTGFTFRGWVSYA